VRVKRIVTHVIKRWSLWQNSNRGVGGRVRGSLCWGWFIITGSLRWRLLFYARWLL